MLQNQLREKLFFFLFFFFFEKQLREKLGGKKYLLALDDMWNEDNTKWLLLKNLLMVGARGS